MRVHDPELSLVYDPRGCDVIQCDARYAAIKVSDRWRLLDVVLGVSQSVESFAKSQPEIAASLSHLMEGIDDKHILKAVFMAGAGGSGKTSLATAAFGGEGFKVINTDAHFEKILTAEKIPLSQFGSNEILFQKAARLRDKEQDQYSGRRLGLLIDATGKNKTRMAFAVSDLEELGYDCYMIYVSTSLESSLLRNEKRGKEGGRKVPDAEVKRAWNQVNENFGAFKAMFGDRFYEVDNDSELSKEEFDKTMVPMLRKIGNKIISRPVSNPIGLAWMQAQK